MTRIEKIDFEISCMFWDILATEKSSVFNSLEEKQAVLDKKTKQFQILSNIRENELNRK